MDDMTREIIRFVIISIVLGASGFIVKGWFKDQQVAMSGFIKEMHEIVEKLNRLVLDLSDHTKDIERMQEEVTLLFKRTDETQKRVIKVEKDWDVLKAIHNNIHKDNQVQ